MRLGTTYICVKDIEKSLAFYKSLLNQEPLYCNDDRWITFYCGNYLSLYDKQYDIDLVKNNLEKFIFGIILLANLPLIIRIVNSRFTKNKTDE